MRSALLEAVELAKQLRHLLEDCPPILASSEDANYFRRQKAECRRQNSLFSASLPKISSPKPPPPFVPVPDSPPPSALCTLHPKKDAFLGAPEMPSALPSAFSLKSLFSKIAPELPLLEEIPSDAFAKKIATRWKTKNQTAPISLLTFNEPPVQKALLENIAKSLDVYFGPAKLVSAESIERDKQWDAFLANVELKLVIACDYTLWQLSSLLPFYRENTSNGMRTLKQIPLFLLPDLSLYLKDPLLKRILWKGLCQKLAT